MLSARYRILVSVVASSGLVFLAIRDPAKESWLPPCVFLKLTGFECPGCGSTRCLHQIMQGNLRGAFDLNVLCVLALPWLLWRLSKWLTGRLPTTSNRDYRYIVAIGVSIVLFGILRNIEHDPFTFLSAAN